MVRASLSLSARVIKNPSCFILLTKTTAALNDDALSYHRVRGLYYMAVVFVATIVVLMEYHEMS